jgi:hypothetical protein
MSEQLPFRIRRSAVEGKRPQNADLELGELALNTYDGRLFAKKDTGGVGVGTTVTVLTPWTETVGVGLYYTEGNVGLGTTNPTTRLWVSGDINFTGNLYQNGTIFQSGGGTSSQWTTYPAGISTLSNVGIGTTNPTTKLQVNGSVTLGAGSTDLITIPGRIASNFYPTGDGVYDIGRPTQIGLGANRWRDANFYGKGSFDSGVDAHDIEIGIGSANLIYSTFGNLELNSQSGTTNIDDNVTISGNTGIGTVTPTSKLHVVGDGRFTGEVTASDFVGNLVGVASTANNVSSTININTSGIITASSFTGNLTGIASTATTALGLSTTANINTTGIITASRLVSNVESGEPITVGSSTLVTNLNVNYLNGQPDTYYTNAGNLDSGFISSSRLSGSYGIDIVGTATTLSNAANITTGFISSSRLSGSYGIDIVGTATTANNLSNAANITTGFISSSRLSGSYGISITGTATTLSNAANITTGFISSERLSGSYGISITGTATTATTALGFSTTASINTSGIITAVRFSGDGSLLTGITTSGSGVVIRNNGSAVGTAGTIDFASNLSVSFGSGIATISATGGSGGTSSQWITTPTGNVGIGSTSPIVPLDVVGGAKFTGIITATQLDLSENASTDDSVLYLSGAPLGTSTKNGLLGIGQLSFSDTDIIANFTHNTNGYAQVVVQNKNSGASSSADIIVNNDRTAGTTYYGDFGINGTTFSGVGPFADPDGTYLYSAGGTLTLGSLDAYALKLATNNTERVRIDGTNVGIGTTNPSQTLHVQGNARITGAIYDSTNSTGTSGQVLQSTATGTEWTTAAGGGTNLGLVVASTYNMFMP